MTLLKQAAILLRMSATTENVAPLILCQRKGLFELA